MAFLTDHPTALPIFMTKLTLIGQNIADKFFVIKQKHSTKSPCVSTQINPNHS